MQQREASSAPPQFAARNLLLGVPLAPRPPSVTPGTPGPGSTGTSFDRDRLLATLASLDETDPYLEGSITETLPHNP